MTSALRDIRLFVAAYEERSFTAAALREHATQSGVSQHIKKLEERFNVALFVRDRGRVAPTPAAAAYYARCVEMLRLEDALGCDLEPFTSGLHGEVSAGLMPTMTRCALAPALQRFAERHPNVRVRIVEGYSGLLLQAVRSGELDFVVVPEGPGVVGLRAVQFFNTSEVLLCRQAQGAPAAPVRLADGPPLNLLLPSASNVRHQRLLDYCAVNDVPIARIMELDSMMGALDYVARSDWVTIVPKVMIARDLGPSLSAHPLVDPPLRLHLSLVQPARRPLSAAAAVFQRLLQDELAALDDL